MSLRDVHKQAEISLGYLCELEKGRKTEVRSDVLARWLKVLNVSEAFARGDFPRYSENPDLCKGKAASERDWVYSQWTKLAVLDVSVRARRLLEHLACRSGRLTPLELAWMLHLELKTLEALIEGQLPISDWVVTAITDLVALPNEFLRRGDPGSPPNDVTPYFAAVRKAMLRGITPQQLERLVDEFPGDLPDADNDEQAPPDEPPGQ